MSRISHLLKSKRDWLTDQVVRPWFDQSFQSSNVQKRNRNRKRSRPALEHLETIALLSGSTGYDFGILNDSVAPYGLTPAQVKGAYGFNAIGSSINGSGETIAIIDYLHDATITSDLQAFDTAYGLPSANLTVVDKNGGTSYPTQAPAGFELETSLDVEWAHAIAPGANILLIELPATNVNGSQFNSDPADLHAAINTALSHSNVAAVSMSFGSIEDSSQASINSWFSTPAGHQGVVFTASTGDSGGGAAWPASSPNVVAVGGTTLTQSSGVYTSETAWNDSNGGVSTVQARPAYQAGAQTMPYRTVPDVSYNAGTGVSVYDSSASASLPWWSLNGTSAGAPQWAGLVALIDQSRANAGESSLSSSQILNDLYHLPLADLHDVTTGSNAGYSAGPGYDFVTGLGTPVANKLLATLTINAPAPAPGDTLVTSYGGGSTGLPQRGLSFQTPGTNIINNVIYDSTTRTFYDAQTTGAYTSADPRGNSSPILDHIIVQAGYAGDNNVPVAAYYDGVNYDFVIYDTTDRTFTLARVTNGVTSYSAVQTGYAGDNNVPVASYYDGANYDFAIYDTTDRTFTLARVGSSTSFSAVQVGYAGDNNIPVASYYDGSSYDFVIYDTTDRTFTLARIGGTTSFSAIQVGYAGDNNIPVASYYDGVNYDFVIYDTTDLTFTLARIGSTNSYSAVQVGYTGDNNIPVTSYYAGSHYHFVIYDATARSFTDASLGSTTTYTAAPAGYSGENNIPVTSFVNSAGNLEFVLFDATATMFADVEVTFTGTKQLNVF